MPSAAFPRDQPCCIFFDHSPEYSPEEDEEPMGWGMSDIFEEQGHAVSVSGCSGQKRSLASGVVCGSSQLFLIARFPKSLGNLGARISCIC
jgi:hypothetical protein